MSGALEPLEGQTVLAHPRVTYISWAQTCSRSDHTARELGGRSYMVYASRFGSRISTIALKYVTQAVWTARILRRDRPDAVFVMVPPVFAALPAFWYAWRQRKLVVLDVHTCAFVLRRWRCLRWLQRFLCRRAVTTLVTNEHLAAEVREAGAHAIVVPDVPVLFPSAAMHRPSSFTVTVVCSFDGDEPIEAVMQAAATVPDVAFYVTGDATLLRPAARDNLPANVTLTGFLPTAQYGALLRVSDVVMDLTTFDHTMLRGAYEAIYQGTPVIVSDWPVLRDGFPQGAVHVNNTPHAIASAIRTIQRGLSRYRSEAAQLRQEKLHRWVAVRQSILDRLTGDHDIASNDGHAHG